MRRGRDINCVGILCFFVGGVVVATVFNVASAFILRLPNFFEFKLFDFIKLVATILTAVCIAHYLKNKHTDRQIQKQVLIKFLDDISEFYSDQDFILGYMRKSRKTQDDRNEITISIKKINNKIHVITMQSGYFKSKVKELVETIKLEHDEVRSLLLDEPIFNRSSDVFPDDKIASYMKHATKIILLIDTAKISLFQ